jgi:peroxiredoxin
MLGVGQQVPDVRIWLAPRESVSLRDLVSEGPIVLLWYLFDWSGT